MWRDDNDNILKVYTQLKDIKRFPAKCPVCGKISAHIYMDIHNFKTRRGGLWVWCSECHVFSHSSLYVPLYWENSSLVEKEELCAKPVHLENIKDKIDDHMNSIIRKVDLIRKV